MQRVFTLEIQDSIFETLRRCAIGFIVVSFVFAVSLLIWDKAAYADDEPKTLFGDALADANIGVSGSAAVYSK